MQLVVLTRSFSLYRIFFFFTVDDGGVDVVIGIVFKRN